MNINFVSNGPQYNPRNVKSQIYHHNIASVYITTVNNSNCDSGKRWQKIHLAMCDVH